VEIILTSIFVTDQAEALRFYTEVLGFVLAKDIPAGEHRWLTVVSPSNTGGVQLTLEPTAHPAVAPFMEALRADGIPSAVFAVDDIEAEFQRLKELGVRFTQDPIAAGPTVSAIFDDSVGNLIQITQMMAPS